MKILLVNMQGTNATLEQQRRTKDAHNPLFVVEHLAKIVFYLPSPPTSPPAASATMDTPAARTAGARVTTKVAIHASNAKTP